MQLNYIKNTLREGINLTTPSHHDLVDTLLSQCLGEAVGTVCTGNDLDLEKVECWSVKSEKVKVKDCTQANQEHKERIAEQPRKWIKPLFDRSYKSKDKKMVVDITNYGTGRVIGRK